jgi:hypothetical protein
MEDYIKKWMVEWVDMTSNTKYLELLKDADGWIEIEGIGRFKGLEIISEDHEDINEITFNFKYEVWDKSLLNTTVNVIPSEIKVNAIPSETKCTVKNCNELAIVDYNGCGDYVCAYHLKKLDKEFDDDYN